MSKFNNKKAIPRYYVIAAVMVLISIAVLGKAAYIMTAQKSYWEAVAGRLKSDSLMKKPHRGNIITEDGELLASSLPLYKVYIDFKTMHDTKTDTLWVEKEDSICQGLNMIFPDVPTETFRKELRNAKDSLKQNHQIVNKRITYSDYIIVKSLPIFRLTRYKSGFKAEELNARRKPYGDLASHTIGGLYLAKDSAISGLELRYDSILRGENGIYNRRKVMYKFLDRIVKEPVDGCDVVSTIDINIQDLAERSLREELIKDGAEGGVAIVMEAATGDIKAMTSLTLNNGRYVELQNNAVSAMVEPGSVFKTASIMLALDDGYIDTFRRVETGGGVWQMYGREMRDHNWRRGGYGTMTVPQVLQKSSNIGVSRLIDQYYHNQPEKYVEGLKKLGLGIEMDLPFFYDKQDRPKKMKPWIRMPKKNGKGQYVNWSKTTLPWMSIGYETQVPPIYMVSFYNAIANKGRFMQPRFVKEIRRNGETIETFEPVCLIDKICKDETLKQVSAILESVVSIGLGKKAGSDKFRVAGKTGTAQIADEHGSYKSGVVRYWLSFCGFFPYDDPKYTCIVCIKKTGSPASGGGMCGPVFRNIAEGVMAQNIKYPIDAAQTGNSVLVPDVKWGNILAADYVLSRLGIKVTGGWNGNHAVGEPVWGRSEINNNNVVFTKTGKTPDNQVPDVKGMGARDAVFLLESRGVRVRINGRGKVKGQSIAPGTKIGKGMSIALEMG